ncbi:hypothetical protein FQA39_LY00073 [Lamprigera yunnana]|nr:hypothetical protein FQA39_LY00073 [Lamprigera yunnana]
MPQEERLQISECIQKLSNEKGKQTFSKRKCNTFVQLSKSKQKPSKDVHLENQQKYTPKEESAGIQEVITIDKTSMSEKPLTNIERLGPKKTFEGDKSLNSTLIGSCRTARLYTVEVKTERAKMRLNVKESKSSTPTASGVTDSSAKDTAV